MESARKNGELSYAVGKVDPELERYNGKGWADLSDDNEGRGQTAFSLGQREQTRSNDGGATALRDLDGNLVGMGTTGATGDRIAHLGKGATVPDWMQKYGAKALRYLGGALVPWLGSGLKLAGFVNDRMNYDEDPGRNNFLENFLGQKEQAGPPLSPEMIQKRKRKR